MLLCFIIIWVRASWWLENRWLDWWGGNQVQLMIHKIHHSLLVIKHHQSSLLGWSGSLETQTFYRLLHGDSRQWRPNIFQSTFITAATSNCSSSHRHPGLARDVSETPNWPARRTHNNHHETGGILPQVQQMSLLTWSFQRMGTVRKSGGPECQAITASGLW